MLALLWQDVNIKIYIYIYVYIHMYARIFMSYSSWRNVASKHFLCIKMKQLYNKYFCHLTHFQLFQRLELNFCGFPNS